MLLDEPFLEKYPERKYPENNGRTMHDLDWGNVQYLHDSSITLEIDRYTSNDTRDGEHDDDVISAPQAGPARAEARKRNLTIYGSPLTPQYGISAFQYPRDQDIWQNKIPPHTDILITHGPPKFHLDTRDLHRAGCQYLSQEIGRVRPRLAVFGHIHASYGTEDVVMDSMRRRYEDVLGNWGGWGVLGLMLLDVLWASVLAMVKGREGMWRAEKVTNFVNASAVGGIGNELRHEPVVVEL